MDLPDIPTFYTQTEAWNRAQLFYQSALKEIGTKLEILNDEFAASHQYNPIEHITSRIKSPESIAKKLRKKGLELTIENIVRHVNDVAGIRIICSFTSDIYRIADLIAEQSDLKILMVKDYLMWPKSNGYMSYHMIVAVPIFLADDVVDTKVEIQIRTIAMDFWASLEHKIYYKFEGKAPESIRRDLKECAQIVSYLDQKMLTLNDQVQALELEGSRPPVEIRFSEEFKAMFGQIAPDDAEDLEKVRSHVLNPFGSLEEMPNRPKQFVENARYAKMTPELRKEVNEMNVFPSHEVRNIIIAEDKHKKS